MNTTVLSVESVGHLSARCGQPLRRVVRAIEALRIVPALVVDDVQHLAENDAQRVVEHIAGQGKAETGR